MLRHFHCKTQDFCLSGKTAISASFSLLLPMQKNVYSVVRDYDHSEQITLGFYHRRAKHRPFLGMNKFSRSLESSPWLLLVAQIRGSLERWLILHLSSSQGGCLLPQLTLQKVVRITFCCWNHQTYPMYRIFIKICLFSIYFFWNYFSLSASIPLFSCWF